MKLFARLCEAFTSLLGLTTISPWQDSLSQQPLGSNPGLEGLPLVGIPKYPEFSPPNSSEGFLCSYPSMVGWKHIDDPDRRSAWLQKENSDEVFDIFTDFDKKWPTGIKRVYHLRASQMTINADGYLKTGGQAFNGQYPGPWIEACWGDELEVTVTNDLQFNGTTIHWHGVRQLHTMQMDGVNGVTQCPIAPQTNYTYRFNVTQYGSSWYHSHYSLQYPDGLAGPMTFHGPSAANYEEALPPFLISDWSHNSAFHDFHVELAGPGRPTMQSIILNGKGTYTCRDVEKANCTTPPGIFQQTWRKGRKYLMRLINTSTESIFIFTIDNHMLQIVGSDFVPIKPYFADSVLVGIGQRYHIVVEARPSDELLPIEDQNYWIRAVVASGCGSIDQNNETVGVIRYDSKSTKTPTTTRYQFNTSCSDEPYESLVPIVPWNVGSPSNNIFNDNFAAGLTNYTGTPLPHGNFSRWDLTDFPLWLNFSNPTITNLKNTSWNPEYCIVAEDYKEEDWVYLIITANASVSKQISSRKFFPVSHPIHLHGHDFVILSQQTIPFSESHLTDGTFNYKNPPRRDVALLPGTGYVAIAFRTDNPGVWLLHCHIAWHASSGLALQILERQGEILKSIGSLEGTEKVCENWEPWFRNTGNWWNATEFQDDSGI